MVNFASFWKSEACGQTVLPDRSVLIGQKLVENAKIKKKSKCDILSNFQTMWGLLVCKIQQDYICFVFSKKSESFLSLKCLLTK